MSEDISPLDMPPAVPPEVARGLINACKVIIKGQNIEINTTLDITLKINIGSGEEDWGGIATYFTGLEIVRDGEKTLVVDNGNAVLDNNDPISDIVADGINDYNIHELVAELEEVKETQEKLQNLYNRLEESVVVVAEQYGLSEDNVFDNILGLADKEIKEGK